MEQEKVGKFIAECRKKKGYTQEELGKIVGVSSVSISKWENGINMPDTIYLKCLSEALDVSIIEILKGEKFADENLNLKNVNNLLENSILDYKLKMKLKIINKILLFVITIIFLLLSILYLFFHNNYNQFKVYKLVPDSKNIIANGILSVNNEKNSLMINNIYFLDDIKISNAEIVLYVGDEVIYKIGDVNLEIFDSKKMLNEYLREQSLFLIESNNYGEYMLHKIEKDYLVLMINYKDENDELFSESILFNLELIASNSKFIYGYSNKI